MGPKQGFGAVSQTDLIRSLVLSLTQATLFVTRCYLELHSANSRTETQFFVPEVGVPLKAGRKKEMNSCILSSSAK